jgi:hypothetical protein
MGNGWHPWRSLRDLVAPATTFTIPLSGPVEPSLATDPIWVGRIALICFHEFESEVVRGGLRALNLRYGLKLGRNRPGDVAITTRLGTVLTNSSGIRTRWAEGEVGLLEDQTVLDALEASAQGMQLPFLFVPDEQQNSAWWVRFRANDYSVEIPDLDGRRIPFRVDELSSGPIML